MDRERWQKLEDLFHAALEREPSARVALLAEACQGDAELRQELELMLLHHDQASDFIEAPAYVIAAEDIVEDETVETLLGKSFGRYQILEVLGKGGMGAVVYLAFDKQMNRKIAIKFLQGDLSTDKQRVQRFKREARAASALNHPNILTVHEIGQLDSEHFIAAEFVDGETLRQRITREPLNVVEVLDIGMQIASALTAAHVAGITHRDIKPENIMLRPDGFIKILDFGIAKLTDPPADGAATTLPDDTGAGTVIGTVRYMSPEQAQGFVVDNRTDIWSLGAVLYEMITGRAPFEGKTAHHVTVSILEKKPSPLASYSPRVPREMEWIVSKALRKNREERYQTAQDLLVDLRHVKQQLAINAELERSIATRVTPGASEAKTIIQKGAKLRRKRASISSSERVVPSGRRQATKAIASLAVLPLINASAEPSVEYLADGITESIINSLSQLPKLRVVPRSTVFRYKERQVDPQQIGQDLNVRAVLTGRLVQMGDRLIVKAELTDVTNDSQVWGEHYNRKLSDILQLEEDISKEISEKLRIKLTGEDKKRLIRRHTKNTDAYQAYLKGRYYWNKRTPEGFEKAIQCFEEATKVDPDYALAYSGLADCSTLLNYYSVIPPKIAMARAKAAAQKGLAADEALAEVHASSAMVAFWYDWDWLRAQIELERAIKLNPSYPSAHEFYSWYFAALGKFSHSIDEGQKAVDLDPLAPAINMALGKSYFFCRRYDNAVKLCRRALDLDSELVPARYFLGQAYIQQGRFPRALAEYRKADQILGESPFGTAVFGHAAAMAGYRHVATDTLNDLLTSSKSNKSYAPAFGIAMIHTALGNKDEALTWLERAWNERSLWMVYLNVDPTFDSLRNESGFKNLIGRMRFPESNAALERFGIHGDALPGHREGRTLTRGESDPKKARRDPGDKAGVEVKLADGLKEKGIPQSESARRANVTAVSQSSLRSGAARINSVAIIPFVNGSPDPNAEYLSDGITDSIINKLSQLPNLRVMARSTVFRYKGKEIDSKDIGEAMGVRAIVTGRVLQVGESLVINAELVDVSDGSQLWGQHYNRPLGDIFSVQEEISKEISESLQTQLNTEEEKRLTKRHTENTEAYKLYLKGRYYWNKREKQASEKAIKFFQEAIELDNNYALAYAGVADCYIVLAFHGLLSPREAMPKAKEATEKALEIDDTLAEARISLAYITGAYDWDWQRAESEYKRALRLNPNYATAHHWYGEHLAFMGRFDQAIEELEQALELDPLSLIINFALGLVFYLARNYDRAAEELKKSLELDRDFTLASTCLGLAYLQKSRFDDAIAELQSAISILPNNPRAMAVLAYAYAVSGRKSQALELYDELKARSDQQYIAPSLLALISAGLGDHNQAFAWLEKSCQERDLGLAWLKVEPIVDSLRSDPRFARMVERVGFPT